MPEHLGQISYIYSKPFLAVNLIRGNSKVAISRQWIGWVFAQSIRISA